MLMEKNKHHYKNQKTVTFNRPSNDEVQIYTAKAIDLTGTVIASDDVLDNTDFYEAIPVIFYMVR